MHRPEVSREHTLAMVGQVTRRCGSVRLGHCVVVEILPQPNEVIPVVDVTALAASEVLYFSRSPPTILYFS